MPRQSGVRPFRPAIATFIATTVAVAALGHASAAPGTTEPTTPDNFASQLDGIGDVSLTMWQHSYPPLNDWTENQIAAFEAEYPSIDVTFELVPFEEYNRKSSRPSRPAKAPRSSSPMTTRSPSSLRTAYSADRARRTRLRQRRRPDCGYTANSLALVTAEDGLSGHPLRPRGSGRELQHRTPRRRRRRSGEPHHMGCGDGSCGKHDRPTKATGSYRAASRSSTTSTSTTSSRGPRCSSRPAHGSVGDGTEAAINSPEARRVFEFWRDVVHTYGVTEPGFTSTFYTDEFGTGRVGHGLDVRVGQLDPRAVGYENGVDFDIIAPPTFDGDGAPSASYAWNWTINSTNSGDELIASQALLGYLSQQGASQLSEAGLINPRKGWVDVSTPSCGPTSSRSSHRSRTASRSRRRLNSTRSGRPSSNCSRRSNRTPTWTSTPASPKSKRRSTRSSKDDTSPEDARGRPVQREGGHPPPPRRPTQTGPSSQACVANVVSTGPATPSLLRRWRSAARSCCGRPSAPLYFSFTDWNLSRRLRGGGPRQLPRARP